jgi:hypothetical protein
LRRFIRTHLNIYFDSGGEGRLRSYHRSKDVRGGR